MCVDIDTVQYGTVPYYTIVVADTGSCSMYVACVILMYVIIISYIHCSFDEVKKKYVEEYQNVSLYNGSGVSLYNVFKA